MTTTTGSSIMPLSLTTRALLILASLNLLDYLDRYLVASLGSLIKADLHLSDKAFGFLGTAFFLVYFVTSPLFGYLGDRGRPPPPHGRRGGVVEPGHQPDLLGAVLSLPGGGPGPGGGGRGLLRHPGPGLSGGHSAPEPPGPGLGPVLPGAAGGHRPGLPGGGPDGQPLGLAPGLSAGGAAGPGHGRADLPPGRGPAGARGRREALRPGAVPPDGVLAAL